MNQRHRQFLRVGLVAALLAFGMSAAIAQQYPTKPVHIIVAFGTGGQTDAIARIMGAKLSTRWGQQVIVENRTGANGNIGTEAAVKAPPDGYTILFTTPTLTINSVVFPSPAFDPLKDLAPIAQIGMADYVLVVHPSLPINTTKEFIDYAKANPGKLNYGSTSFQGQLMMEMINFAAGTRIGRIPYRAQASLQVDLVAGRLDVYLGPPSTIGQFVERGQLRALGVTGEKPISIMPSVKSLRVELPTLNPPTWYAVLAPLNTPAEIIAKINADLRWTLEQQDVRETLDKIGFVVHTSTPEELRAMMTKEVTVIEDLVRRGAMKATN